MSRRSDGKDRLSKGRHTRHQTTWVSELFRKRKKTFLLYRFRKKYWWRYVEQCSFASRSTENIFLYLSFRPQMVQRFRLDGFEEQEHNSTYRTPRKYAAAETVKHSVAEWLTYPIHILYRLWTVFLSCLYDLKQINNPLDTSNFDIYPEDGDVPPDESSGWDSEF